MLPTMFFFSQNNIVRIVFYVAFPDACNKQCASIFDSRQGQLVALLRTASFEGYVGPDSACKGLDFGNNIHLIRVENDIR